MYDEDGTPAEALTKDLSMTDQTVPRSLAYPVIVNAGIVAPTTSFDRNS
jgi:hypothetical protein